LIRLILPQRQDCGPVNKSSIAVTPDRRFWITPKVKDKTLQMILESTQTL